MFHHQAGRAVAALLTIILLSSVALVDAQSTRARTGNRKSRVARKPAARSAPPCNQCTGRKAKKGRGGTSKKKAVARGEAPCYPRGYVDPKISRKLNAALRDMRRAGIRPVITSTWRSSQSQAWLHNCSNSKRCRRRHPGLYRAMPPGRSLHEAGLAVDIAGVATGPRGAKRLTSRGRRIVAIMRKHGFIWRYGLADPVHFEVDPRRYGYRNASHAIQRSQSQCQVRLAAARRGRATGYKRNLRSQQTARRGKNGASKIRVTVKVDSPAQR